jgi:hypothetical protein
MDGTVFPIFLPQAVFSCTQGFTYHNILLVHMLGAYSYILLTGGIGIIITIHGF